MFLSYEYYQKEFATFYPQILAEAHGMVFDLFVVGILIFAIDRGREKRWMITYNQEELEDLAISKTTEASLRSPGIIKRLNRLGITKMHINGISLINSNLKAVKLCDSYMIACNLTNAKGGYADFSGALISYSNYQNSNCNDAKFDRVYGLGVNFEKSYLIKSSFRNAMLNSCNFSESLLMFSDFQGAVLVDANFRNAVLNNCNFKNTQGLTVEMILEAKSIEDAEFDDDFKKAIDDQNRLLKSLTQSILSRAL